MPDLAPYLLPILEIIGVNLLLSGDNAVVIAMACRGLPAHQRRVGIVLGAGVAILLRFAFTAVTTQIMALPWLKAVGAVLLLYVAVKLLMPEEDGEGDIAAHDSLWGAVRTVAIADVVMSLDNVIAIAAAAKGNQGLILFGLLLSIPLVVAGSAVLLKVIDRFPVVVWAGAALLGWIAGGLFVEDVAVAPYVAAVPKVAAEVAAAAFVLAAGALLRRGKPVRAA